MSSNDTAVGRERLTINVWWVLGLLVLASLGMAGAWFYSRPGGLIFAFGFTVGVLAAALGVFVTPEGERR